MPMTATFGRVQTTKCGIEWVDVGQELISKLIVTLRVYSAPNKTQHSWHSQCVEESLGHANGSRPKHAYAKSQHGRKRESSMCNSPNSASTPTSYS